MKKQTGMWIDGSKAVIISLIDGKEQIDRVEAEIENRVHHFSDGDPGVYMGGRHLIPEKRINERERHQLDQYLDAVLEKVKSSDELYVFGPAETRVALQRKLDTDKSYKDLAARLRAVEPADNMTKNQIVARVKEFFRK
ncbi:MAG: hypothetical protein JNN04_07780 [Cyclobacteriaceae bacterium]|nr:hypothetical protein [Cyclobacteriaceae bacterium]